MKLPFNRRKTGSAGKHTFALAMFATSSILTAQASAASFNVIHNFTNGADGGVPGYTLAYRSRDGMFFGAAMQGGLGNGTVFSFYHARNKQWKFNTIYDFTSQDGQPLWGVTLNQGGIYTNASYNSVFGGPCGSAIQLHKGIQFPGPAVRTETPMHTFAADIDGCNSGNLLVDKRGTAFGVTQLGGAGGGGGTVFELAPLPDGNAWAELTLYSFRGDLDGSSPHSALVRDSAGNLYGTASGCQPGKCSGTVFKLHPGPFGWIFSTLHVFKGGNDGGGPVAGLLLKNGNLYGATTSAGANGGGTVFELSPAKDGWSFKVLASMAGSGGPVASLAMDGAGNLYGTNAMDGANGLGSVFKLTPGQQGWTYQDLHDFTGGADGGYPGGGVIFDNAGNMFGTATTGGAGNWGVVYEITQ